MNILELCDFYSNYGSNFIPSISYLENELSKLGHKTYFIFSDRNLSKDFYAWEIPFSKKHNTTLMDFSKFSIIKNVVNYIKENDIKIVHAHFIASFFLSEIKKRSPKDVKFFEHIHSAPYNNKKTLKAKFKRIRNFLLLNHKIKKICISSSIVGMTKYIYPLTKIFVCKNSINFERLIKSDNLKIHNFNILLFGYNYYIKGVDVAIEAFIKFKKTHNCTLDIVFSDNFSKNNKIITSKYGLIPSGINLLRPQQDVVNLYKTHQIYLNASRTEGLSFAILESYYCGCLCILSDISQNKESNLPNVIYFKSGDSNDLLNSLEIAYSKKDNYSNDCDYVEREFNLKKWSNQLIDIFFN